ncbi:MAG: alpha-L-fucosidase [Saprospiraceae bacterium]
MGLLKYLLVIVLFSIGISFCKLNFEPSLYSNIVFIDSSFTREQILSMASYVVPTARQLKWQQRELTAFIHFGINTFTDQEWGDGTEDPNIFNPQKLDANQWVSTLKEAGFKLIIITAKHHDGFCLWPSTFTKHSVRSSPWKKGKGDVIKELADACVKQNMDLGVYLSPWDRHERSYGTEGYNIYFKNQLRELLTNYGDMAEVWFDGAIGEGPNGKRQVYDWKGYYALVRSLQPKATIAIMGPDVRWVGTESGYGRETEWSPIPIYDTSSLNGNFGEDNILRPKIEESNEEVATINQLINAKAIKWYPSEVDVSIRPGWFYHASQDNEVKSPDKLLDIYFNSVGKNSSLLLNVPPDKNGLIPEKDVTILKVFYNSIRQIFGQNLVEKATVTSSEFNIQHRAASTVDHNFKTYWTPDNRSAPYLTFEWESPVWFNVMRLSEEIEFGQRVSSFQLEIFENDAWITKLSGTTIGYKRLLRFPYIKTQKARLIFSDSRGNPFISEVGFYKDLPSVQIEPSGKPFNDSLVIRLSTNSPEATIHYSQNFTIPSSLTNLYSEPLRLTSSSPILALAINADGQSGFVKDEFYSKAKYKVKLLTTPDPEYLNEGGIVLCDGVKGDNNLKSKKWLGYQDENLEVIFDLKENKLIREINVTSLVDEKASILTPTSIKLYGSSHEHPEKFELLKQLMPEPIPGKKVQTFTMAKLNEKCQYLKIVIENPGKNQTIDSLKGKWIFVSEIEVN